LAHTSSRVQYPRKAGFFPKSNTYTIKGPNRRDTNVLALPDRRWIEIGLVERDPELTFTAAKSACMPAPRFPLSVARDRCSRYIFAKAGGARLALGEELDL